MAATQSFNDWNSVAQYYGPQIASQLQQANVPLNQVGQTIAQADPNFFQGGSFPSAGFQPGGSDPGNSSINNSPFGFTQLGGNQGLLQALGGSGGQQQQQGQNFDPTKNPNYPTSLLGAQALNAVGLNANKQVITNPSPADTPTSSDFAKSGVSAVSSPQTTTYSTPNPQTSVPSIFSPATPNQPTNVAPLAPTPQFNAASFRGPEGAGRPFAAVPPVNSPAPPAAPNTLPPPPGLGGSGVPGANYTAGETNTVPGPISGLSSTATPPGPASLPPGFGAGPEVKHMAGGGQVGQGNTDTVPAMLTPGEYVINRNAAQEIGRRRLDQLNAGQPLHMQSGGSIPGASPSYFPGGGSSYGMGAGDPNAQSSDAQSYAFGQLSPSEQVALQGGNSQAQQKYNQLVNSYQGSSGSPTPMSAQMGSIARPTPMAQVHPTAPAAPANQPQQPKQAGYSGSLDQWLAQYGHTPQGQAYIAQNGNVGEVQRYLQNLTTPQQTSPQSPAYGYAPRASLVSPPANYGAAPRAQLVGLPPGQGEAYDPKTYGINTGASTPNLAGGIASGIGQIGSAIAGLFSKGGGQPRQPIPNAIPSPSDFKSQTPDIVLQGHQVGQPNVPGGYVLMAQPHDQGSGYPQSPYGSNLS